MISRTVICLLIGEIVIGFTALAITVTVLYLRNSTEDEAYTFSPTQSVEVLTNPLTGWCPWGNIVKPMPQPFDAFVMNITWNALEPEKGEYKWDLIEKINQFERWKLGNKRFILRVILDNPQDYMHTDIPRWLIKAGCYDGENYNLSYYFVGHSPNYSNPLLIAEHEILINAIANRYKDDPRLIAVQIGSIGHRGEWNTEPFEFPPNQTTLAYIDHYLKAFPNTILQIPYPMNVSERNRVGLSMMKFGDKRKVDSFAKEISSGIYNDSRGDLQPVDPELYKAAVVSGSFYATNYSWFFNSSSILDTLEQARSLHVSYIGPNCPADDFLNSVYQDNYERFIKTIGYRFVLRKIEYIPSVVYEEPLEIKLVIDNMGIAPFYPDWPLEVSLSLNGKARYSILSNEKPKNWGIGPRTVEFSVTIPSIVPRRKYALCLAIVDSTGTPSVKFAINEKPQSDGRYCFGEIVIVDPGLPKLTIILIGGAIGLFTVLTAVVTFCIGRVRENIMNTKVTPGSSVREQSEAQTNMVVALESPVPSADKRSVAELNTESGESKNTVVGKMIRSKKLQVIN